MSATKYQIFLKTVECGSFTKAAEELNFSQSGISHAISSLEEELGVTLLSRNRGGVTLAGHCFRRFSSSARNITDWPSRRQTCGVWIRAL